MQFIHESCKVLLPWPCQSILFKSSPLILSKFDKLTNLSMYPIYAEYWLTVNLTWTDYFCIYSKTLPFSAVSQVRKKDEDFILNSSNSIHDFKGNHLNKCFIYFYTLQILSKYLNLSIHSIQTIVLMETDYCWIYLEALHGRVKLFLNWFHSLIEKCKFLPLQSTC